MIWGEIITGLGVIGFVYGFLRNFKADMKVDMQTAFAHLEKRMDIHELRMISLEEKMFHLATGKTLKEAIIEEKLRREER